MAIKEETIEKRWMLDVDKMTDSTTGTASNTVNDVGASFSQATINDNFASLTEKVNTILDRIKVDG